MSLEKFKTSVLGGRLAPALTSAEAIARMETLSREGKPAVAAVDERLPAGLTLDDTQKQQVGRWVRDIMAERGWRPLRQKRLSRGRLFSSGAVYGRIAAQPPRTEPVSRANGLDAVRDLVRRSTSASYGVDDFIADKRREAASE